MSYKIIRFYKDGDKPNRTIKHGLTLEEAQEHCSDPETSSSTAKGARARRITEAFGPWFEGYDEEGR